MFTRRKKIEEVFTPRNSKVNSDMYIARSSLEKSLLRSVKGTMHSFLFGESGNGKSWLYKKVFAEEKLNYVVANCANASRKGSITKEIYTVSVEPGSSRKTEYSESKSAGIKALGTAELKHQGKYDLCQEDDLLYAFESLYQKNDNAKSIIVLDNVETIFDNQDLMNELSDILILLDDERYAQFNIKIVIVGLPNQVIQYFSTSKNSSSVANRIEELQRVPGLQADQVRELAKRGFESHLKIEIKKGHFKNLYRHIHNITLGVPQRIHEYCETLAFIIEDNSWEYNPDFLKKADQHWLLKGLRESYAIIDCSLNSDETSDGRRNQVIYALGKIKQHQIHTKRIGVIVSEEFPETAPASNSGIGRVLSFLSKGETPIIQKVSKSSAFVFKDPRYLMCIRIMLHKNENTGRVVKRNFQFN